MVTPLDDSALDTIFRKARTQNKWSDKPVSREQLVALYDLMRWGPTRLPRLFPHVDARSWFIDKPGFAETTAFRNSSLQGAYFIMAARAIGLDCGPMSGFDNEAVDREFFPGGQIKSNFI